MATRKVEANVDIIAEQINKLTELVTQLATFQMASSTRISPTTIRFTFPQYHFDKEESLDEYLERFQLQLNLYNVPEGEWSKHLRVHMGAQLNASLKTISYPEDIETFTFERIKTLLLEHYIKSKNKYSEAIKFRKIIQAPQETICQYVTKLKQGAKYCQFGEFLDYSLIIQFIHGVLRDDIRDEIIARKIEKFDDVVIIASDMEATREAAIALRPGISNPNNYQNKIFESKPRVKHSKVNNSQRNTNSNFCKNTDQNKKKYKSCDSCGGAHDRANCKFRYAKCIQCNKLGHILRVCRSKNSNMNEIAEADEENSSIQVLDINSVTNANSPPPKIKLDVKINSHLIQMELDTGGACSIISLDNLKKIIPNPKILHSERKFRSYTNNILKCLGYIPVEVTFCNRIKRLNLYVVDFPGESIFGREWIKHFSDLLSFSDFFKINSMDNDPIPNEAQKELNSLLTQYEKLFDVNAGTLAGPPVDVHLKPDAKPIFARARLIPYSIREQYGQEIDKKIQQGFYKKVAFSEWASPTHIVVKAGKIRITGDYKSTVNPQINVDEHPIPRIDELFHKLRGAKFFCKLDITDAFMSLQCSEKFSEILTLNTPTHGLIRPVRAQYGIANIPAIWQRRLEEILHDVPNAINFFDDILVFHDSIDSLLNVLKLTFEKLFSSGLKLKRNKCEFLLTNVEFLGHRIDAEGLHKLNKHITPLLEAPQPKNADELRSFLGKVTYYHSFIPNLSSITAPLRDMLLPSGFIWTKSAIQAFRRLKSELTSDRILTQYDPKLPLILSVDASPVGLGAVLSHIMPNGDERPIEYASKALSSSEKNYPQIDREALAVVWGVKRFFQYVYGRKFTIYTDNKPISHIFAPNSLLPKFTLSRCSNYASYLTNFNYDLKFKRSIQNSNADCLSRLIHELPNSNTLQTTDFDPLNQIDEFDSFVYQQIDQLPITAEQIATETLQDSYLQPLLQAIQDGKNLKKLGYRGNESEFTVSCGCLMYGHRVVIPQKLQSGILKELHIAHIGINKMKGLARSLVYWNSIDKDIETVAKSCQNCLEHSKLPPKFNQHHWEYPNEPWERIHIDYAGPIHGKYLLIIVDAYSKWTLVEITNSSTTHSTISILKKIFGLLGIPRIIVSDNGPQFTSADFTEFLKLQGVKFHKRTAPYHPATNGQAERYVQTVKKTLETMNATVSTMQDCINKFLLQYHKAPHPTTGEAPSKLFLGRPIRSKLDSVIPYQQNVPKSPTSKFRKFSVNEQVLIRSYNPNYPSWINGRVVRRLGDLHYEIKSHNGTYKRHIDQMKSCSSSFISLSNQSPTKIRYYGQVNSNVNSASGTPLTRNTSEPIRRSKRTIRLPARYSP